MENDSKFVWYDGDLEILEGAPVVAKATSWTRATDAYKEALGAEYEIWAKQLSKDLEDADPEDYDDIVQAALAVLAAKLKKKGRSELVSAFEMGAKGVVSPAGWARLADIERQNEDSIDKSLIPAVGKVDWRQILVAGGAAAVLGALLGTKWFAESYSAVYWRALHEGAGEQVSALGNPPVRRVLNDLASHCSTCPPKAAEYANWEEMVALAGIPGDGSDECRANCACWAEYQTPEGEWTRF